MTYLAHKRVDKVFDSAHYLYPHSRTPAYDFSIIGIRLGSNAGCKSVLVKYGNNSDDMIKNTIVALNNLKKDLDPFDIESAIKIRYVTNILEEQVPEEEFDWFSLDQEIKETIHKYGHATTGVRY